MKIIFFTHPPFLFSQSMPRFANYLLEGMRARGHEVDVWSPTAKFYNITSSGFLKKWFGYIDQYILFPQEVRRRLKKCSPDTLFVFTDQALGPWIPLVAQRKHVIHCHDFLAQQSAVNNIPQNPTSFTGKQYQAYIRKGYKKGKAFISVSQKTKEDLHTFLDFQPRVSEVVYNGLNQSFSPRDQMEARKLLAQKTELPLTEGYWLHVGGNQWYKNRTGVIKIYDAWRSAEKKRLPLLLIGKEPGSALQISYEQSPFKADIHFLTKVEDQFLQVAYAGASVFLFPSLAEGFGWPIAEAMASGCPVVTSNEAPMTEVGGNAAFYIPVKPHDNKSIESWSNQAAKVVDKVLSLSDSERNTVIQSGLANAARFNPTQALDKIEDIYSKIFSV